MLMLQKFRSCSAQVEKDREKIENSLLAGGIRQLAGGTRHVRPRRQNLTRERKDFRQLRRPN